MPINPLSITIPPPNVPFLNPDGSVSRQWGYFMLAMLTRTGGIPGTSSADLAAQIASLEVELALSDVPFTPTPQPIPLMVAMEDPPPPRPAPIPLMVAMEAPDPPKPINPLLAAILVSDFV